MKKWLRFYDEKTNRMDVARCLADSGIVNNDLLHIISMSSSTEPAESTIKSKFRAKLTLACFEVLVPLTWPLDRDKESMTQNHYRHLPVLELAQLGYKRDIINYDGARILHAAVRAALPAIALSIGDRSTRDHSIIKLVLYFLRNMAMIEVPPHVQFTDADSLISRSATFDAFHYQDIFLFLLTLASNMGDDFRTEDVVVLETLFHLLKRTDPNKVFMTESQAHKADSNELKALLSKEKSLQRTYGAKPVSRHSRFGTMVWVKRADGKMSTVTGQDALLDASTRKRKMDSTKKFNAPRRRRKEDMEPQDLGASFTLSTNALSQLRSFVDDFLDSGFNPLFQHLRKSLEREAPYVLKHHIRQFFYLAAWFLEAERARQRAQAKPKRIEVSAINSFNLVAAVLNQEMFIFVQRHLASSFSEKEWLELTSCMRCLSQILLTVQDMTTTGMEEDEEIADNILNRIFYEEETHDLIAKIASSYKEQGFDYLDASTELVHNYLRILEGYSKQNVDLMVRSKRRARRKNASSDAKIESNNIPAAEIESGDDEADAHRETKERKFDFIRFARRFIPQGVVDTFVAFTRFYHDLNEVQLKRAHRYFYRVAFKHDMSVMLFRVDIMHLLYNMVKGPQPLDKTMPSYKEWEELVKQIIKKCTRKIEERPALVIEMLFSKISQIAMYLEYGIEHKDEHKAAQKPGAELEFRDTELTKREQIATVVGVLLDKGQLDNIQWIKAELERAENERRSWEDADTAMRLSADTTAEIITESARDLEHAGPEPITICADNDERKNAMFKNSHLRLLMKLVGFERLTPNLDEVLGSVWVIPPKQDANTLKESRDFINNAEFSPPTFTDGKNAENQLKRVNAWNRTNKTKRAGKFKAAFDTDSDALDEFLDDDLEAIISGGGPKARKQDWEKKKGKKRSRKRDEDNEELGEEELNVKAAARKWKRRQRELERHRKIKSEMYVHTSDDESGDEEAHQAFLAREEVLRERMERVARAAIAGQEEKALRLEMGLIDDEGDESESGREDRRKEGKDKSRKLKLKKRRGKVEEGTDQTETTSNEDFSAKGESENTNTDEGEDKVSMESIRKKRKVSPSKQKIREIDGMDIDFTPEPFSNAIASGAGAKMKQLVESGDDEEPVVNTRRVAPARRKNVRSGFIVESSDEE